MKKIKKPNVKGPRFRERRVSVLTAATLKELKKKYPEYSELTLKEFRKIIMTFNTNITKGIMDNRSGVELPEGLGTIFMGTCPPAKTKNIDYKRSSEYGVEATHRNWDSDNNLLKIFYTNYNTKLPFQNKQAWAFKAGKTFRSDAAAAYREDWAKYIKIDSSAKISAMFDRYRKKQYAKNMSSIIPEGYDEFKL